MNLKVIPSAEWTERDRMDIDRFIMHKDTTGEFINTIQYLSYHGNRFIDDSIAVKDMGSGSIRCVVMAVVDPEDSSCLVSHMGTTFAGPIINIKDSFKSNRQTVRMALEYYEGRYRSVSMKTVPPYYVSQEAGVLGYLLMQSGYIYGMTALANVIDISRIQSEEDIYALYTSGRRNHVKKAFKEGLFYYDQPAKIDPSVWSVMNGNLENKFGSRTTHTYEKISGLQQDMPMYIVPYEARTKSGEYAAFALVYKFKNVFHTQYLDVNYKFTGKYPNLFLVHNLICQARKEGYRIFSFGASTENGGTYLNEGLFSYKAEYGGGSIILPIYTKTIE